MNLSPQEKTKTMNKIFWVSVLFLIGQSPVRAAFDNPDADRLFGVLSGSFQTGKYESTLSVARDFIRQYPRHPKAPSARYLLAESYFLEGRWGEATTAYKDFLSSGPEKEDANLVVSARLRLGECHFNFKKYLPALDHFLWVTQSRNDLLRAEALQGAAYCYLARGEHSKAEDQLVRLLESHAGYANLPRVIVPLALLRMEREEYASALELLARAPDDAGCLYYRGVCQRLLNRVVVASQMFKELIGSDFEKQWTDKGLFQMGEAYFQSRDYPLAIDSFTKVFKESIDSPLRPYALFRMGCVNFQNGQFSQAGQNWSELAREFPLNLSGAAAQYLLAEIALRQNELPEAIVGFSNLITNKDYTMDAQFKVVWSLAVQGQYDLAEAKAQRFLKDFEWGELHAKVSLLTGICQSMLKKPDAAVSSFQFILDRYPRTIYAEEALYLMAVTLVQERRYGEVVTHVLNYLKAVPASSTRWQADTYYWVAESYYNIGQYERANQTWELITKNYRGSDLVPGALLGMAASLSRLGRYDQAVETQAKARDLSAQTNDAEMKKTAALDSADVFFNKRDYERAASFYDDFSRRYPDDSRTERALYQGGLALYRLEFFSEAIAHWSQLFTRFPNSSRVPDALFQVARTNFGLGQYKEALSFFQRLVENHPTSPLVKESMIQMGQCYYNAGDIPRAIDQYGLFLQKYPNDEKIKEVEDLLQMAFYKQGKSGADMSAMMEKFPQSQFTADIYWELGAEAYNRKEYDKALDYFQRLILHFPEGHQTPQAFYYKADCYFLKGDFKSAVNTFKNFIINYPQDPLVQDSRFKLAVSYFSLKDYGESAVAFNNFQEAHPSDPKARDSALNVALCHVKGERPFQAIEAYQTFIQRYSNDEKVWFAHLQIGQLYEDVEDFIKAAEAYKKIPDTQPEVFEALFNLGHCYEKMNVPTERKNAYENLRRLTPKDNRFRLAGLALLGELYEEEEAIPQAIEVYTDILSFSTQPDWQAVAKRKVKELQGARP